MRFHRQSIRLRDYDYTSQGLYYVTICTQNRELYFERDDIKEMINNQWQKLTIKFSNIDLDEYTVMSNHLHGIIVINDENICRGDPCGRPQRNEGNHKGYPYNEKPRLGDIIGAFKSITTNYYIQRTETKHWPRFDKRLWQRNYYEHIIRNEQTLNKIRKYIRTNSLNWETDRNNPKNCGIDKNR